jgi:hypothetical protein
MLPNDYTYTTDEKTFLNLIQQILDGRDQFGPIKSLTDFRITNIRIHFQCETSVCFQKFMKF